MAKWVKIKAQYLHGYELHNGTRHVEVVRIETGSWAWFAYTHHNCSIVMVTTHQMDLVAHPTYANPLRTMHEAKRAAAAWLAEVRQ
jgi:hypothetical protein